MAQISYPTQAVASRPWLLDDKHLLRLDSLFEEFRKPLEQEKQHWVTKKAQQTYGELIEEIQDAAVRAEKIRQYEERVVTNYLEPDLKKVVIFLKGARSLAAGSFSEALRSPEAANETPLGFSYDFHVGRIHTSISVERSWFGGDLRFSASPSSHQLSREIFGALRNWTEDVQTQPWVRWWFKSRNVLRYLLLVWMVMGLLIGLLPSTDSVKSPHKERAHQLLQNGISQQNLNEAVSLLLALESDYQQPRAATRPGRAYWRVYLAGVSLLLLLSVCPRICLGIWAGKKALIWWKIWIRILWVTVPGSVLWPQLVSMVSRF